ncbi:hypothetical protein [Sulfurisphaera ohwakuensis]|nr:hypothetical protein [Sulfurisphaera ohwakuensis]
MRELLSLLYTKLGDKRISDFTKDNREKLINFRERQREISIRSTSKD